jgi:hypothetical protein
MKNVPTGLNEALADLGDLAAQVEEIEEWTGVMNCEVLWCLVIDCHQLQSLMFVLVTRS